MTVENIAGRFLADVFGTSTVEPVYLSSLPNADARERQPSERRLATRELPLIEKFLKEWDKPDRAVYFCTATIKAAAKTRSKQTIAELNGLHVDIDFKSVQSTPEEIEQKLQQLQLLPSKVVHSGNGLHGYWHFKEALQATPENIAHVEELLRLLADHLGGDLACAEASRLMRLPGSHNTKGGTWIEVKVITERPLRYEIDDLEEWLTMVSPVIQRKPQGNGPAQRNGHDEATNPYLAYGNRFSGSQSIDVEGRLAAMAYQGAGDAAIHTTQLQATASLLSHGKTIEETVEIVLAATRVAADEYGSRWNWQREENAIRKMCATWIEKHPDIVEHAVDAPASNGKDNTTQSTAVESDKLGEQAKTSRQAKTDERAKANFAAPLPTEKHGGVPPEPMKWLVRNRLPQTGAGLEAGQWGTYKTFIALDLSAHVMLGWDWTGEPIYRQCGVLVFAPEGAGSIALRLAALVEHKIRLRAGDASLFNQDYPPKPVNIERLPFEWASACPLLLGKTNPLPPMIATARAAHEHFTRDYGVPLGLIWVDTMATAAGWTDENDNAEAARAIAVLRDLSTATQSLVMGVDHFGKDINTGARGASAKEANSDFTLAILGDKELTGDVKNTRMALRKLRDGPQGLEIPFTARVVDMGKDERGYPVTSVVIDWAAAAKPSAKGDTWTTAALKLLRKSLMNVLVECGTNQQPYADGPVVRAVDLEIVRTEFYRSYAADGDAAQKHEARRKAFRRAVNEGQTRGLIGLREVGDVTWIWLGKPEDSPAKNARV
jgi:hypothetical protein